jgi:protein involved in temperature-dependent protein secretion
MANAQVVQACSCFHEGIGTVREGITKGILDTTGSFDARNGVFDSDADTRQGAIVPFVIRGQFLPVGLFFG